MDPEDKQISFNSYTGIVCMAKEILCGHMRNARGGRGGEKDGR